MLGWDWRDMRDDTIRLLWAPGSKQEVELVNLVPRSLTGTFFETPCRISARVVPITRAPGGRMGNQTRFFPQFWPITTIKMLGLGSLI
jgi:hypothetical protein